MKKISVVIPCYNDEKSVFHMHDRLTKVFKEELVRYDYEIIFVDDRSLDNTWKSITKVCNDDKKCKGIRNATNFGYTRNVFSTLRDYADGDAAFLLFSDLQDPPENLPLFVEKWEKGAKVVVGQKKTSSESKFLFAMRTLYYKVIGTLSAVKQIQHFNGYGLYDKGFINILKQIDDPQPYLKGIVGEFAYNLEIIQYEQSKGERQKLNVNFSKAYDAAMVGITAYTKTFMRMATFIGAVLGVISVIIAIYMFVYKLTHWDSFPVGIPSLLVGMFLIGAVILFFLGIMGEYILSINTRSLHRPLVIVGEKLNFDDCSEVKTIDGDAENNKIHAHSSE